MSRLPAVTALLCAALVACLCAAASSSASSTQLTVVQDDAHLLRNGHDVRVRTINEMAALGADIVKVQVYWSEVAPGGAHKPAGFDAANPASYDWDPYDDVVRTTVARGLRPFLSLGGRAPDWATGRRTRRNNGTYRPSAREFELFARAAGTRYSGSYLGLPRVDLWSPWNEPNLESWLAPQRGRGGVPLSPSLYRGLYLAAYRGLRDTGHAGDTILLGELMPLGTGSGRKVPPLEFLREMACLDRRYRPYAGRAATARGCARVGRIPTSGLAYHPYTKRGGVRGRPRGRDDASIGQLSRVTRVLDALARRGKLPRRLPIWITEYGFQTNPPDPFQYPIGRVPGFMDESEWIAFRNSRVASYAQYTLIDDPLAGSGLTRYAGFQQGLRFANGQAKPGVYSAFQMPAFVRLLRGGKVEVSGGLRFGEPGTRVTIASRVHGGRYRPLGSAHLSASGYFHGVFAARAAARSTYRIGISGFRRVKRPAARR